MGGPSADDVVRRLLAWFDASHRDLPWRRTRDPYRVLLAEYLLQRTRVASGIPYYERFLARFPDGAALAAASEEDVLRAWEGLGLYRRARNLHAAARAIADRHGGRIPSDVDSLAELPGVGPYTAGAVASIAFGARVPAVDGNATRVLARLFRVEADVTRRDGRRLVRALAADLVPASRPGAFNQALMELGATVCTPSRPSCERCPLESVCLARAAGVEATLPRVPRRANHPEVRVAFALVTSGGRVLLTRRPASGLLGGLWGLPGGEVRARSGPSDLQALVAEQTGLRVGVGARTAAVAHAFSHKTWKGAVFRCTPRSSGPPSRSARFVTVEELADLPLVAFHRRILRDLLPRGGAR
ncbi:MAG: A/G-specific adenine glycosylase [Methanobacteriota archaeon]